MKRTVRHTLNVSPSELDVDTLRKFLEGMPNNARVNVHEEKGDRPFDPSSVRLEVSYDVP